MGIFTSDNIASLSGIVIVAITLILIFQGREVSSGHAMVLAAGAALMLLPSVSNFEWSNGGLKYTRRDETADLASQVKKLAEDNIQANETIKQTTEALKVANERLNRLEAGGQTSQNPAPQDGGAKPPVKFDWGKYSQPTFFEDLLKKSDQSVQLSNQNRDALTTFQKQFNAK
ncbi:MULTISPECIES: hypothetical protein [Rhizobium]|uniref:Uncharacterized protein n=1 Tax=Rhizobium paranaense TaxID=1650438 RepID=A0A7W8XNA8_9HYPH|nr:MULTISPECIES: hypothetical protein [Rhizobium]MBB5572563.1 hypothetical protein [Rhizobium paranaense]PST63595.1 hypothetical protein C9E91_09610 [Rhizobium sp. SEMIA4064]